MQRVVIAGVDTVLGSNLALELAQWFDVFGLYERYAVEVDGCHTEKLAHTDELMIQLERIDPQWVIHCGGISQSSWNGADESRLDLDNVRLLLAGSQALDYRLTVISSDAVFTGPRMFHREDDPALATSHRPNRVRQIEQVLEKTSALVVRTHAYGWSPLPDFMAGIEQLWDDLHFSASCQLDATRHATPILASDLAPLLCQAMDHRLTGLYHIAGAERINPYRFGIELASILGLPSSQVHCWSTESGALTNAVPSETSLNTHRAQTALQLPMPLMREGLRRLVDQAGEGYSTRLRAKTYLPTAA